MMRRNPLSLIQPLQRGKGAVLVFMKAYDKALETYQEGLKHDPYNQELLDGLRRIQGFRVGSRYVATGFIISKRGHFATNVYEISEKCVTTWGSTKFLPAEVFVTQIGKQKVRLPARVLIADYGTNLAICQVVIPSGISIHVFEFGYAEPGVVQTVFTQDLNAACGFSGGPSFDVKGRVMAINQSTSSGDLRYLNLVELVKHLWRLILLHFKTGLSGHFDVEGSDEDELFSNEDAEELVSDEDAEEDQE
ncbi:hypothetical protein Vadar_003813 [Vaccinium darrowii]|uniref:Uncharacterized protein n=1 Tax=Vaccinium darrowii TaxID=229202 RepID=A0ACB7Y5C4_9ERIC|nr:hypothetical protein Vadar_003813 [Vaccinium darrowii]